MLRSFVIACIDAVFWAVVAVPWLAITTADAAPVGDVIASLFPILLTLALVREWALATAIAKGRPGITRWFQPLQGVHGGASIVVAMLSALALLSVVATVSLAGDDAKGSPQELAAAIDAALMVAAALGGLTIGVQALHIGDATRGQWLIARAGEKPAVYGAQLVTERASWGAPTAWESLWAASGVALQTQIQGVDRRDLYGCGSYRWRKVLRLAGVSLYERQLADSFGIGTAAPLRAPWRTSSAVALICVAALLSGAVAPLPALVMGGLGAAVAVSVGYAHRTGEKADA